MKTAVKGVQLTKITDDGATPHADLLAVEEPLEIRLGFGPPTERVQQSLSVTMRTPGHDFELALGFLFTEGIITSYDQVESIRYCSTVKPEEVENVIRVELSSDVPLDFEKFRRHFYTSSSCGICGKSSVDAVHVQCGPVHSDLKIKSKLIQDLPQKLREAQLVFEHTGGLHASALFSQGRALDVIREDVGRHNALDKVVGAMLIKNNLIFSNYVLMISGRASFELVQKAAVAGIPIIAAVGAPSSLAVDLAGSMGMTLLGFVRDGSFNVYCGEGRIF